jgi:tetratricopeptide (TPR) repeat protein
MSEDDLDRTNQSRWGQRLRTCLGVWGLIAFVPLLTPNAAFGWPGFQLEPKSAEDYIVRGHARGEREEYAKAVADLTEAIRLDPKSASAHNIRGFYCREMKEYDRAIADFTEAIRLNRRSPNAYVLRATVWELKKEYKKAVVDYGDAIRLDGQLAYVYNNRAWLWAACADASVRDGKKGIESATKACELAEWKHVEYIDTLAAAYAEAGDFDSAVKWQSKAIALCPIAEVKKKETRLKLYLKQKPYRDTTP